ncbi:Apoptosis-inducing factor [Fusarium acuminatum]|uniref:Apoptosis-inducing factor n=1 Tax=Fusarium acuminatum TaxID=5515 RepID=A0ABZ2X1Z7_9HYPO
MSLQALGIYLDFVKIIASFLARLVVEKTQSIVHRFTYRPSSDPLNVVVVGGSFAGCLAAQRLAHTLPTGYRVILVEKHSHFHYTFSFPRNAVFSGREQHAFIAYDGLAAGAPDGIFRRICDEVTEVGEKTIATSGGVSLDYDYLVVATGASQPPPARLRACEKDDSIVELQELQQRIEKASRIAVVGGGAVGVELATDMKDRYPDKHVTLIHSRKQLLPRFGPKLHEHVSAKLAEQGIEVLLGEKPTLPDDAGQIVRETNLKFTNGETKTFDLVIPCTGFRPHSNLLATYSPKSIASSGEIKVKQTLQVDSLQSTRQNIFAVGDVAQSGGPKQARAAMIQVEVAVRNILSLIKDKSAKEAYVPQYFENTLQLTLGTKLGVMYLQKGDYEWLKEMNKTDADLNVGKMRWQLNAKST